MTPDRHAPPSPHHGPMLYPLFRALSRVALRWYYRDVTVTGAAHIPRDGPLLVAVNHPNALVDALVAVSVVPRRVGLTAKATLWENPVLARLLPLVGIVPLRRAADERAARARTAARPKRDTPRTTLTRWASETGRTGMTPARGTAAVPRDDAARDVSLTQTAAFEAILVSGGGPHAAPVPAHVATSAEHRAVGNAAAFEAILATLGRGGAVLVFPEGKSHSDPQLAPLKTGLARMALQARDERGVAGLRVLPIGLVFERKWAPRSRVLVQVGEPLALDAWAPRPGALPVESLTAEVEARLRAVTLNFDTAQEEARTLALARALASAFEGDRPLGAADTPLAATVAVAHRVEAARQRLAGSDASAGGALPPRAAAFQERLGALRRLAAAHRVLLDDAEIATGLAAGARFTVREGLLALLAAPLALWGALNHLLPLELAWWLGRRASRNRDDPAMRTIVAGLFLVLAFYAIQTGVVAHLAGPWWALLYLVTLPLAGVAHLRLRDRLRRAWRRARTYRLFRRDPALRDRFAAELAWLRAEAVEIERSPVG